MADLFDAVRSQIHERMKTLRPVVDESHRLEQALTALGGEPTARLERATPRRAGRRRAGKRPPSPGKST